MLQNTGRRDRRNLWDKTWKDKRGNWALWQTPNALILAWAGFTVLSFLFAGWLGDTFAWVASISLIVWSLLEIFRGVNYFRRVLGALVFIFAIMVVIKSF